MTDPEIKQYLDKNNWSIPAQDGIIKIFNTSPQILDSEYDMDARMMTIYTPENEFTFHWLLNEL